jgi:death-on-curing protein
MTERLYPDELRYIHDEMLRLYGGLPGEKEPGMIEYVCEKPFATFFGQDVYPQLFQKAAIYMITIATGHYFADGNKRTAAMATYSFLMKNGYELIVSDEELFETCIRVAKKEMSEKELTIWLASHSHLLDEEDLELI